MELPTCKTCPYWASPPSEPLGECKRYPPLLPPTESLARSWEEVSESMFEGVWPDTKHCDWCGEHPDFPAYIRSLKSPQDVATSEE